MSSRKPSLDENQAIEQRATIAFLTAERGKALKVVDLQKQELERLRTALSAACKDVREKTMETRVLKDALDRSEELRKATVDSANRHMNEASDTAARLGDAKLVAWILASPYILIGAVILWKIIAAHVSLVIR